MNIILKKFFEVYSLLFFLAMLLIVIGLNTVFHIDGNEIVMHIIYFLFLTLTLMATWSLDQKGVAVLSMLTTIIMVGLIEYIAAVVITVVGYLTIALAKKTKIFKSARIAICVIVLALFASALPLFLIFNITDRTVRQEIYSPDKTHYVRENVNDSGAFGGGVTVVLYKEYFDLKWVRVSGQHRLLASGNLGKLFLIEWVDNDTVLVDKRAYSVDPCFL